MKKIITSLSLAALLSLVPITAFARTYTVCNVTNCNITRNHNHNGKTYAGHHDGDGHYNHSQSGHGGNHRGHGSRRHH